MTLAKQIDDLIIRQCEESNIALQPMYPWVVVRVCDKEQKKDGIWLPNSDQNKTLHEGIVLSTWRPCTKIIEGKEERLVSDLIRGDRVLFSHFAGVPIEGRGSGFRLVKERSWGIDKEGGIMAVLEYDELHTNPVEKLRSLLDRLDVDINEDADPVGSVLVAVTKHFILVDRNTPSVTISGR